MSFDMKVGPVQELFDEHFHHQRSRDIWSSIDKDGNPVPWMTYPAIFYLDQLDLRQKIIFEWGAGNSSLFFAQRAKKVKSIEYKKEWYEYVLSKKSDNIDLILADKENYASVIDADSQQYDVIVIDGEIDRRFECAEYAVSHLHSTGMIVVDNSDWLEHTCAFLRTHDFIQVDMAGLGPINNYTWCTSFFFRRDFNFTPLNAKTPSYVQGGLKNVRD